ncbi:hypothetical protein C8Q72DRAFT_778597 [Fomitopsis betulina]|nr:hypothetical protein C8Q72DRAFT_778597 [Fomitopsis betulina]
MFARLASLLSGSHLVSALVVVGDYPRTSVFHCVPEDGFVESRDMFDGGGDGRTTFRRGGATELRREQIGTLLVGPEETVTLVGPFRKELKPEVHKLWSDTFGRKPQMELDVARLVEDVLRPAMLDFIHHRERRADLVDAESLPVYIVYVNRSKLGPIFPRDPTSLAP